MKPSSTLFLRVVIFVLGLPILAACFYVYPIVTLRGSEILPQYAFMRIPYLTILYVASFLYFFALYQGFRLLNYIDQNNAFSDLSVNALKNIKISALSITVLLISFMPVAYTVGDMDDAPGIIILAAAIVFIPLVISVFAALLEKLLHEAIQIKSENDLTV
jgi:hypothetical protein